MTNLTELKPVCSVQDIINKFCYTIGMLPTSYKLSLTYEEQLLCIGKYLEESVIPALNNNAEAVLELQNLFIDLKNYVENFFDNLNIQSQVNAKIDNMVQSGLFEELLNKFINNNIMRTYNTTTDLIQNAQFLIPNMKIKTLGYYEQNDNGGATFLISNTLNPNIFQIKLSDNLYANFIGTSINIVQAGAKQGEYDNSSIIQQCLNLFKTVIIPEGTFQTSTISLNSNQLLKGINWNSIIEPYSSTENTLISITDNNLNCHIENLHLNGNSIECNAITIIHSSITNVLDTSEKIYNVKIEFFNGDGISINSTNSRSVMIDNCNISNNQNGIYCIGTDNFIFDTLCYWNKLNGIYIKDGASNKINNTKCFGNQNHGIFINSSSNQLSNIECQDNYFSGINLQQCWGNTLSNIISSTNGVNPTTGSSYPNINLSNCYDTFIQAMIFNRSTTQANIMVAKYGLKLSNCTNITCYIKTHILFNQMTPFYYDNLQVSNTIIINEINYSLPNLLHDKLIGIEGTVTNLSQLFTQANIRGNSDGSIRLNKIDQSQYITIGNNVDNSLSSAVSVLGNIDITNLQSKQNASFYFSGSNEASSSQAQCSTILTFINSAGGIISQSNEVYGYNSGIINSVIPENTAKVQYTITYRPQIPNLNKSFAIQNVQLSVY